MVGNMQNGAAAFTTTHWSVVLTAQGNSPAAIAACRAALELRPDQAEAWNNICAAYNKLGRYEQAAGAGKQALRYNPDLQLARNNLQYARDMAKTSTPSLSKRWWPNH